MILGVHFEQALRRGHPPLSLWRHQPTAIRPRRPARRSSATAFGSERPWWHPRATRFAPLAPELRARSFSPGNGVGRDPAEGSGPAGP